MNGNNQNVIRVKSIGDGDFVVTKGGDVYRGRGIKAVPDTVKAGDIATSAEICEWIDNSITVIAD